MSERLLNLREIADLAHVRRPVVSMWIKRFRASATPFPSAQLSGSQKLYRADEVVAWLEATRHGNNPQARLDVDAHALWKGIPDERRRTIAQVLSALLVLRTLIGDLLAGYSTEELLDLADQYDPDDECLVSELTGAGDLTALARVADDLVEAAWSVGAAHQQVHNEQLRAMWRSLAEARLSEKGTRLVVAAASALLAELGDDTRLMDPTGSAVDVLAEIASVTGAPVLLMRARGPLHRLTRRQLLLGDVPVESVDRGDGDWTVGWPTAHMVLLPSGDYPDLSAANQLDLVEEIRLQLDSRQLVLLIGPASVFSDALASPALTAARDNLLRTGCVRAVVRLPAGLRPSRPREHLALWLLTTPGQDSLAERRVGVADLTGRALTPALIEGLTDDLLAVRRGSEGARLRAWAQLSNSLVADVVSRGGSLVQARKAPADAGSRSGADWVVRLRTTDESLRVLGDVELAVAQGQIEELTIGEGVADSLLRVFPGQRLALDGLRAGSVPVISGHSLEVVARADRLALHNRAGDVRFTEPGDVVFSTHQGPHAIVDQHGGSVVLAPGRILRLRGPAARMLATCIAVRINAAEGTAWRSWPLARLPQDELAGVTVALEAIADERARLLARLGDLDRLGADLIVAAETRRISVQKIDKEKRHGATTS